MADRTACGRQSSARGRSTAQRAVSRQFAARIYRDGTVPARNDAFRVDSLVFGLATTEFEYSAQDTQPISAVCRALSRFRRRLIASTGIWTYSSDKIASCRGKGKQSDVVRSLRGLFAYSAGAGALPAGNIGAFRDTKRPNEVQKKQVRRYPQGGCVEQQQPRVGGCGRPSQTPRSDRDNAR